MSLVFFAVFLRFSYSFEIQVKVANDAEIDHEIEHLMLVLEMRC